MPSKWASRAQIFQPFKSLKGLDLVLASQERRVVKKRILSEEDRNELDRKIHLIYVGLVVMVVYYDGMDYIQVEGVVSKINLDMRILQIVQKRIHVQNIVEIHGEGLEELYE